MRWLISIFFVVVAPTILNFFSLSEMPSSQGGAEAPVESKSIEVRAEPVGRAPNVIGSQVRPAGSSGSTGRRSHSGLTSNFHDKLVISPPDKVGVTGELDATLSNSEAATDQVIVGADAVR